MGRGEEEEEEEEGKEMGTEIAIGFVSINGSQLLTRNKNSSAFKSSLINKVKT